MKQFTFHSDIPVPAQKAFSWHMTDGALQRLIPPWEKVEVHRDFTGPITSGAVIHLQVPALGPFRIGWKALHTEVCPPTHFVDLQEKGPFSYWKHEHRFEQITPSSCAMKDDIEYKLPLSPFSNFLIGGTVHDKLNRMFAYRHRTVKNDLECISKYDLAAKRILISGASGLVGSSLRAFLSAAGHTVIQLVRGNAQNEFEREWDPQKGELSPKIFNDIDVVIHLSGEPIAQRWTEDAKKRILTSRVNSTTLLANALCKSSNKPSCFITASGIGFYGDRGSEILTESDGAGTLYLSEVAKKWEEATLPAQQVGIRTAHMRFGAVLSPAGGALSKMLLPFRLGLGGRLGSGQQYFSWIAIDDLLYALYHLIATDSLTGPFNFCAPEETTNKHFTEALARTLHRPSLFPVPASLLKLGLGQMAKELLLASTRAKPSKLLESGFTFRYPELTNALPHMLGQDLRGESR